MSNDVNTEHEEVVSAFISEFIGMRNRLQLYIQKYELDNILSKEEVKFLNDISIACKYFTDSKGIK